MIEINVNLESTDEIIPAVLDPKSILGIFYTSGSTGKPKGVIRTHEFVLHRLQVDLDDYGIGPSDNLLYMRQFNVSSSLSSLLDVLLTGATLTCFDFDTQGIGELGEIIQHDRITIFSPPIELMRHFLDNLDENTIFPSVRCAILAGDVLYRRDVERMRNHLADQAVIIHHLSSSESGLLARKILTRENPVDGDIIPLGKPVPGREIMIIDTETGSIIQDDRPGEITVRSDILFPGYWKQPDLSAEKLIVDPNSPTKHLYCTGDLGYFRPDGQLVFLGRKDFRVKIRGFSIDLASIESVLMSHDEIKRAVITSLVDPRGQKRLVAYIVLNQGCKAKPRKTQGIYQIQITRIHGTRHFRIPG